MQSFIRTAAVTGAAGLLLAACGTDDAGSDAGQQQDDVEKSSYSGALAAPAKAENAFTYDPKLAPAGAELAVEVGGSGKATTFALTVTGLLPDRGYAAHAHQKPCGEEGDAAGPHFQHKKDPAAGPDNPSVDADYANPENEVWLDVQTDAEGNGTSEADVPFNIDGSAPASVVVHAKEKTPTEDGTAGKAGDRIACLSLEA
jgi:Cu-Zn family superoxide dismutase